MKIGDVSIEILGGLDQIGGNIILLSSAGTRLCLDVGTPLEGQAADHEARMHLREKLSDVGYCLISHAHQDHWGYLDCLPDSCLIYSGDRTHTLIRITRFMQQMPYLTHGWRHFKSGDLLNIGPFLIKPFLVDHSAFDAYCFLIISEGVRMVYTGDIRFHGRKRHLSRNLASNLRTELAGKPLDLLITEGTNLGDDQLASQMKTSEADLEQDFTKVFSENSLPVLVQMSGQNMDRLVTIYRACLRTGRLLILDPYTAFITSRLRSRSIPGLGGSWKTRVLYPDGDESRLGLLSMKMTWVGWNSTTPDMLHLHGPYVLLFRYWIKEVIADKQILPDGSSLVYSMSNHYLPEFARQYAGLMARVEQKEITFHQIHVSGHAYPEDLATFIKDLEPRHILPVHTKNCAWFDQFGVDVVSRKEDGE